MIKFRKLGLFVATFAVLVLVLAACQPETVEVTRVVEQEVEVTRVITETVVEEGQEVEVTRIVTEEVVVEVPVEAEEEMMMDQVTLDRNLGTEPPTADPQLVTDTTSAEVVHNTFISLTRLDQVTAEVLPWLATDWSEGEDADGNQTWTFNLRDDVHWVRWDNDTQQVVEVTDGEGNPAVVMPSDVEFGVKRAIDPETASQYAYLLYGIKNAQPVNEGDEELTLDDVGVSCDDEALTCTFTLESAAPWFPSIVTMPTATPVRSANIDQYGDNWTEPGLMQSSGAYVMSEWIHGSSMELVKNPFWIDADSVQIEVVDYDMVVEASTAFAMYENNELDTAAPPLPEMDRVRADPELSQELSVLPLSCTYFYGFINTKYPMTDARVRLAFSQAIDRQSLVDNVLKGGQKPASSFAPEGIFGAPAPGTVGVFYDPDAAQANLQAFLDEEGLTLDDFNDLDITLMHNTSEGHAQIAAAIQQMWADNLGVDVRVENQEWAVYLNTIEKTTPIEEMPHMYRLGWCADYADENNWVHEVFNATEGSNRLRRNCADPNCQEIGESEFDEITKAAQLETDPAARADLYAQAEEILAAEEAAYAPIYHYTSVAVTKPWLSRTFPTVAAPAIFEWQIDWDAKTAALGQ
jgi:oligopeptide transport system substrate-binding protein